MHIGSLLRFTLSILIVFLLLMIVRHILRKKKVILLTSQKILFLFLSLLLTALLFGLFSKSRLENNFISFSSTQESLNYMTRGNVLCQIEGRDSALIVVNQGENAGGVFFIPKSKDRWKIPEESVVVKTGSVGDYIVIIHKCFSDYYAEIIPVASSERIEIEDSLNSEFVAVDLSGDNEASENIYYCAFLNEYDDTYEIYINGSKISLN